MLSISKVADRVKLGDNFLLFPTFRKRCILQMRISNIAFQTFRMTHSETNSILKRPCTGLRITGMWIMLAPLSHT